MSLGSRSRSSTRLRKSTGARWRRVPDRELEDIPVIRRSYSMPSGGRGASLLRKQRLEFCVDAVGHGLDSTHLRYSGIDSRRFLNGHQVNGIEGFEQREAAVQSRRVGMQHRAQSLIVRADRAPGWLFDVCVTH